MWLHRGMLPVKEGGIKALASLAPLAQKIGLLLRTPLPANSAGKIQQKCVRQICFNGKMHSTTFYQMHLANPKI